MLWLRSWEILMLTNKWLIRKVKVVSIIITLMSEIKASLNLNCANCEVVMEIVFQIWISAL